MVSFGALSILLTANTGTLPNITGTAPRYNPDKPSFPIVYFAAEIDPCTFCG
jgi:hypothetical protein